MKRICSFLMLLTFIAIAAPGWCAKAVIFDTDMDSDVDDVAALCQLHVMADRGESEILGVAVSGLNPWSGPCVDAINTFYKRPNLAIGVTINPNASKQNSAYAREVAEAFPHDFATQGAVSAVELYRRTLASQPDRSVTIISVGDLTNLADLLRSAPDKWSPLDGRALVASKVAEYVCMGSRYPAETDPSRYRWGNFRTDPESARYIVENWPTQLTFTGGGAFADSMAIGSKITTLDPKKWPVSLAYRSYFEGTKQGPRRHVADSIAVYVGVRGFEPFFKVVEKGHNEIDEVGRNAWKEEPDAPNQRYTSELLNRDDAPKVSALLEELAMSAPRAASTP